MPNEVKMTWTSVKSSVFFSEVDGESTSTASLSSHSPPPKRNVRKYEDDTNLSGSESEELESKPDQGHSRGSIPRPCFSQDLSDGPGDTTNCLEKRAETSERVNRLTLTT